MWNLIRTIGYYLSFKLFFKPNRILSRNEGVIISKYNDVIASKREQAIHFKTALEGLYAQDETKKARLAEKSKAIAELRTKREGAQGMAKKRLAELGNDRSKAENDVQYLKCKAAFTDFSTTIEEQERQCSEIEADLQVLTKTIGQYVIQAQTIKRELDKLESEKHETVADVVAAKQAASYADSLVGITEDSTNEKLRELRAVRSEVKAAARASNELAGLDTRSQEAEFLDYASKHAASDEFDRAMGFASEVETKTESKPEAEATTDKALLPE